MLYRLQEGQIFEYAAGKSLFNLLASEYHDIFKEAIQQSFAMGINDYIETKKYYRTEETAGTNICFYR